MSNKKPQNMVIQGSLDGKTWRPVSGFGSFKSKKALKEWFNLLIVINTIDWQVGFLVRFRDGRYYRAVHKNGQLVKY